MAVTELTHVSSHGARTRLSAVVARLTAANVLGAASGFITGPLLARALGASGRGDLQAILVPLGLVPAVCSVGITSYAYRTIPRGRRPEEVLGSLGLPLLVIGACIAVAAVPIADALAGGRDTVRTYLTIGLAATPLVLLAMLLSSSLAALERWRAVTVITVLPFVVPFGVICTLSATGHLTVAGAAAGNIAGGLLVVLPGVPLIWRHRRLVVRARLARAGIAFGLKSWLGGLAQLANLRLDQFLMITVVAPRTLGLYAVAATFAGASGLAVGALAPPLMARVAGGEIDLLPRAVRVSMSATLLVNLALAALAPLVLSVLFGDEFGAAVPMALLLLLAALPLTGASVLSTGLQADGAPLVATAAEGIALVITVVGLTLTLRPLGGIGAALVSCAAYSASFGFQLMIARRRTTTPARAFLVPTHADVSWAWRRLKGKP